MSKDKIREQYEYFFKLADADGDGFVTGGEAAALFRKSGLSDEALRNVWAQVSQGQPNLNKSAFFMALGLIALVQGGKEAKLSDLGVGKMLSPSFAGVTPPGTQLSLLEPEVISTPPASSPSPSVVSGGNTVGTSSTSSLPGTAPVVSAGVSAGSGTSTPVLSASSGASWVVPESQKPVSAGHFATLDVNGSGMVGGVEAKEFFLKSTLPASELAKIWALSDVNCDGKLSLAEFQIAFYLTQQRTNSIEIPSVLPASLYESVGLSPPPIIAAHPSPSHSPAHSAPSSKTSSLHEMPSGVVVSSSMLSSSSSSNHSPTASASALPETTLGGTAGTPSNFSISGAPPMTSSTASIHGSHSSLPAASGSPATAAGGNNADFRLTMRMDPVALRAQLDAEAAAATLTASQEQASGSASTAPMMALASGAPSSIPAHLQTTPSTSDDWVISADVKATYDMYFSKADEMMSGYVSGPKARELFTKASLPNSILAEIWALSDTNNDGQLDKAEFALAMHLINLARRGIKPPTFGPVGSPTHGLPTPLPLSMLTSAGVNPVYLESVKAAINAKLAREREAQEEIVREQARREEEARREQARREEEARREQMRREEEARLAAAERERQLALEREAAAAKARAEREEAERLAAAERERERLAKEAAERAAQEALQAQLAAAKLQEERAEMARLKQQMIGMLKEKERLVAKLKETHDANLGIATQLAKADYDGERMRSELSSMELEVEKAKIKGASVKEHSETLLKHLQAAQDDKATLETLIEQKKTQYSSEVASVETMERGLRENKEALSHQAQDIATLTASIAALQRANQEASAARATRAFDPQVLQQKLLQEKIRQDAAQGSPFNGSSSSVGDTAASAGITGAAAATGAQSGASPGNSEDWAAFGTTTAEAPQTSSFQASAFEDDFGTAKGTTPTAKPNTAYSFEEETDMFGKGYQAQPTHAKQDDAHADAPAAAQTFPLPDDDFFSPTAESTAPATETAPAKDESATGGKKLKKSESKKEEKESKKDAKKSPRKKDTAHVESGKDEEKASKKSEEPEAKAEEKHKKPSPKKSKSKELSKKTANTDSEAHPDDDFAQGPGPEMTSSTEAPFKMDEDEHAAATATPPPKASTNPFPTTDDATSTNPFPKDDTNADDNIFNTSTVSASTSKAFDDLFADVPATEASLTFGSPDDLFGPISSTTPSTTSDQASAGFKNAFDEKLFDD